MPPKEQDSKPATESTPEQDSTKNTESTVEQGQPQNTESKTPEKTFTQADFDKAVGEAVFKAKEKFNKELSKKEEDIKKAQLESEGKYKELYEQVLKEKHPASIIKLASEKGLGQFADDLMKFPDIDSASVFADKLIALQQDINKNATDEAAKKFSTPAIPSNATPNSVKAPDANSSREEYKQWMESKGVKTGIK